VCERERLRREYWTYSSMLHSPTHAIWNTKNGCIQLHVSESQLPHKSVNLSFTFTNMKPTLAPHGGRVGVRSDEK